MFYFLSLLLSWLCGMLVILITAFFSFDQFSVIDITSFAMMTFVGFLILFLLIYLITLKTFSKKISRAKQFIYLPLLFSVVANLPLYYLIWKNIGNYYGRSEATLFIAGFFTSGFIFGLFWAWKNWMISQKA